MRADSLIESLDHLLVEEANIPSRQAGVHPLRLAPHAGPSPGTLARAHAHAGFGFAHTGWALAALCMHDPNTNSLTNHT